MKTNQLDQFYTSKRVVNQFLKLLKKHNLVPEEAILIEPAAGDGKFLDGFKKFFPHHQYQAFDIEKNHDDVIVQDFLTIKKVYDANYVVIGNPPFGYKAKMAIKFINKASEFSDIICFVVPVQFRRWNVQKQINENLKLIYSSKNLAKNSFLVNNRPYNVNCCLQIWIKKDRQEFENKRDLRIKDKPKNSHEDFQLWIHNNTKQTLKYFDKNHYQWDFAIVRQGFYNYCEKIVEPDQLIINRQYLFVKYNCEIARSVFELIDFEQLANSNTTIRGFSNSDLVRAYVKAKRIWLKKHR